MASLLTALTRITSGLARRFGRRSHEPRPIVRVPAPVGAGPFLNHRCANGEIVKGVRICEVCGQIGVVVRGCSSSVEFWGKLRAQTGLNPLRPRPSDAVKLVWTVIQHCPVCDGWGYCEEPDGRCPQCTACEGRGTIPALTDPRVQEVLRSIEARRPGAVAPGVIVAIGSTAAPSTGHGR